MQAASHEPPPTPAEFDALQAHFHDRMNRWSPALAVVFALAALLWWPLDLLLYVDHPVGQAALARLRGTSVVLCLAFLAFHCLTPWGRRWPDVVGLASGLVLAGLIGHTMAAAGGVDGPWIHYLYFTTAPTVVLLWPLPRRVVANLLVVAVAMGAYVARAPEVVHAPLFWASLSFLMFTAGLSTITGHLVFGLVRNAHVQGQRRAASEAMLAQLTERQAAEIEARTADLRRLARHSVEARDAERRAVARDLHDSLGQQLVALRFAVAGVRRGVGDVEALDGLIDATADGVRRLLSTLRPRLLDQLGCAGALQALARETAERAGLEARVEVAALANELPAEVQGALFHILQEALTNVEKHASARNLSVSLEISDVVRLVVADDGVGLGDDVGQGLGRLGMAERALAVGGQVVWSSPPGTTVRVEIPRGGDASATEKGSESGGLPRLSAAEAS